MKLIERISCPICFNSETKVLFTISYNDPKVQDFLNKYYNSSLLTQTIKDYIYQLVECNNCKLIYQKYIPDDEFAYELYEKIISHHKSLEKKLNLKNLSKVYEKEITLIKKIFKNKNIKVLEFGAGWGFWSLKASESGFDVDAFELSVSRIKYMKKKGVKVIENLSDQKMTYDFIYSDQTIEHISDPHQIFKQFLPNLKVGGYILLKFPSSLGFKKNLNKNYIPKKDAAHPLEHINIYNRSSLNFLIKKYNLSLINIKSKFHPTIKNFFKDIRTFFYFDNILIKKN